MVCTLVVGTLAVCPASPLDIESESSATGQVGRTISSIVTADTIVASANYQPTINPDIKEMEEWEMIFDEYFTYPEADFLDYRSRYNDPVHASCYNRVRKVTGGSDGKDFYFKGVLSKYPEAWIHIAGNDQATDTFFIASGKKICLDKDFDDLKEQNVALYVFYTPTYTKWNLKPWVDRYDMGYRKTLEFYNIGGNHDFVFDAATNTLKPVKPDYGITHDKVPEALTRDVVFDPDYYGKVEDFTDYPSEKIDRYMNVRFRRIGPLSVDKVGMDTAIPGNGTIYNLSGLPVPDDRLIPGIYIRNGKKFVVR